MVAGKTSSICQGFCFRGPMFLVSRSFQDASVLVFVGQKQNADAVAALLVAKGFQVGNEKKKQNFLNTLLFRPRQLMVKRVNKSGTRFISRSRTEICPFWLPPMLRLEVSTLAQ